VVDHSMLLQTDLRIWHVQHTESVLSVSAQRRTRGRGCEGHLVVGYSVKILEGDVKGVATQACGWSICACSLALLQGFEAACTSRHLSGTCIHDDLNNACLLACR